MLGNNWLTMYSNLITHFFCVHCAKQFICVPLFNLHKDSCAVGVIPIFILQTNRGLEIKLKMQRHTDVKWQNRDLRLLDSKIQCCPSVSNPLALSKFTIAWFGSERSLLLLEDGWGVSATSHTLCSFAVLLKPAQWVWALLLDLKKDSVHLEVVEIWPEKNL